MATEAVSNLYQSFEDKKWTLATVGTGFVSPNSDKVVFPIQTRIVLFVYVKCSFSIVGKE